MKLEVVAIGCATCKQIEHYVWTALQDLGMDYEIEKITKVEDAIAKGVRAQPAFLINGRVVVQGRMPTLKEVKEWLTEAERGTLDPATA